MDSELIQLFRHSWGDRSFSSAAPCIRNFQPLILRSCLCTTKFKSPLKTYLVSQVSKDCCCVCFGVCFFYCALNALQVAYVRITSLSYIYYFYNYYNIVVIKCSNSSWFPKARETNNTVPYGISREQTIATLRSCIFS